MILITGATGLIGGETARILHHGGASLRLLARRNYSAPELGCPGAEVAVADFDSPQTLRPIFEGVTAVLLVSPSTPEMVQQQCAFIDALRAARVNEPPRIVKISGFLTDLDSSSRSGRWHAQIERYIDSFGLAGTYLRPPFFMQNLLRMKQAALSQGVLGPPIGVARIGMVDARDIAAVAATCLLDSKQAGQRYLVTGPEAVSFADVASEFSKRAGRTIEHQPATFENEREKLQVAGTPPWRIDVLMEFYRGFTQGLGAELAPVVRELTGENPRSLATFLDKHWQPARQV